MDQKHGEFIRQFAAVQPSLYRYICSLLPNFSEADDILQEVAVISWEKYSSFDPSQNFKSWVFGIARNKVLHSKRRFLRTQNLMAKALEEKAEKHFVAQELGHLEEKQDALNTCIEHLDQKQQEVLLLRYKEKMPSEDMASKLKRSAQQIRTQLFRLRSTLKSCINNKLMSDS
ncbi:MAG: sigma-70 family RNA polymerase sigma factor [Lentisphaeraceae bacterium]|nr:sigma-70 family RNA polymerase sigma factor [Lentisphaeraceae bacterium]